MKNKKLIGLASLMLVLGVTGCPSDPGTTDNPDVGTKTCEKHEWGEYEVIKAPTCTEDGERQRTCKVCGAKDAVKKANKLGHDYKDQEEGFVDSTCTQVGQKTQKCSRCGDTRQVEVAKKSHTWVDIEGGVEATCTEAGTQKQKCSVCGTEQTLDVAAKGHSYGDAVRTKDPTCTEDGNDARTCSVCGNVENTKVDALGHDFELVGGAITPDPGKAAVRLYHCKTCGIEYLGFKASEVTEESAETLVFETETNDAGETVKTGARFFGRPIGNSLGLDPATGDAVVHENNTIVYCKEETGDFFEYDFVLTKEQAETLETCRLYCDAQPANYLNGADFWAYAASSDDWTPGYYIDDNPEHIQTDSDGKVVMTENHARCEKDSSEVGAGTGVEVPFGKRITDYRYALYVDNPTTGELEIQQFDADTKVPTEGSNTNMKRKEYVLPYTFHLHEGLNKISLRMAGGYRSTFYNFTFRPYVEPTPITVNESALEVREGKTVAITGASQEGVTYTSSNTNIATVDANGVVTGVKAGDATISVSKEGNFKDAKVAVKVLEKEGVMNLDVFEAVVAPAEGGIEVYNSSSSGKWYRNPKKDTTLTYNFQSTVAGKFDIVLGLRHNSGSLDLSASMGIKVNDVDVTVAGTVQTSYDPVDFVVGQADLKVGDNTMVISFPADSALYIKSLKLSPAAEVVVPPQPVHEHTWTAAADPAEGENDAVVKKYTCECGLVKYEIAASTGKFVLDGSSAWKNDASNPTKGDYFKLSSDGHSFHFTFALPKGFTGKMYQRGYMDSYSSNKNNKLFYARDSVSNIAVTVNNAENPIAMTGDYPAVEGKTYENVIFSDVFGTDADANGNSAVKDVLIGDVTLGTANTITYKRVKTVNLTVSHLVFIGTEVNA